jgi:hypothetical protein
MMPGLMRRHWWIDYLRSTVTVSRKPYQWHKCGSLGVDDPDFLVRRLSQQAIVELEESRQLMIATQFNDAVGSRCGAF